MMCPLDVRCCSSHSVGVALVHADCAASGSIPVLLLRWRWGRAASRPRRTRRLRGEVLARPSPVERSRGFRRKEINRIRELIEVHQEQLLEGWNEFFHG